MKNFYVSFLTLCVLWVLPSAAQLAPMSSYPSAAATVYLDFDGHYFNGTGWNMSGPLDCAGSNLTDAQVSEIFHRVSEDYRPFNLNITTDSTKYWSAPLDRRMRLILTVSSSWYGNAGGVSYIGSFTWGDNTPAFVFTALLNSNTKYIAEAASHEIGHTLGLRHQAAYDGNCVKTSEYHSGVGSGTIGWAPIMGVGYYRNQTLWNIGANPYGCTSIQDDLGVITTSNGFSYRSDDHSNNTGGSTSVSLATSNFTAKGVIERNTDADVFKFSMPAFGRLLIDAIPFSIGNDVGANLVIQIDIMTNSNSVVASYNPADKLSAMIDTLLSAGNYFIRVSSKANIYAPQYASLGSYELKAAYTPGNMLPVYQLDLRARHDAGRNFFDWTIVADEQVVRQVLEVSQNGTDFTYLQELHANARAYSYNDGQAGQRYYRLQVHFDNGTSYYSNIVPLKVEALGERPRLMGNLVHAALQVHAPPGFDYYITDANGRVVSNGRLPGGSITLAVDGFSRGMYIIRFTKESVHYTERFMKP